MERAEFNRHSRARIAETAKDASGHATCNAGRAGVRRPSEALHPTRSSDVLPRISQERVPTSRNGIGLIKSSNPGAAPPRCSLYDPCSGSTLDYRV